MRDNHSEHIVSHSLLKEVIMLLQQVSPDPAHLKEVLNELKEIVENDG